MSMKGLVVWSVIFSLGGLLAAGVSAQAKKPKPKKPAAGASSLVAAGKKVYDSNGCAACHAIKDKGGKTGPDLSKFGAEKKSSEWVSNQIRDPKKNLPESIMPAYGEDKISAKDLKSLAAFLGSLK